MWSQSIIFCAKRNPAYQTTLRMLAVGVLACATSSILHQVVRFGKGYAEPAVAIEQGKRSAYRLQRAHRSNGRHRSTHRPGSPASAPGIPDVRAG